MGYTDEQGVTLPPLHPRCRCAIAYVERGAPAMSAPDVPKWAQPDKSKVLSKEEYKALRALAEANDIALSGVKKFDGTAQTVREAIGTLVELKKNFPKVSTSRYKLTLNMDSTLDALDFAITRGRIINLNANAFRDVNLLAAEYLKSVADGYFVKGTTYRAIINHEFGHVVADVYKLKPLEIACQITGLKKSTLFPWLRKNLSEYAGSIADGGEIIAEVFADMSTDKPSEFSRKFFAKVLEAVENG